MRTLVYLSAIAGFSALAISAQAANIATWNFDTLTVSATPMATLAPSIAADSGTGTLDATHASASTVYSTPAGNGSAKALSSNNYASGDFYQFTVSTTGLSGIALNFDQTGSATGPLTWNVDYSTNGSTFTTFANYAVPTNAGAVVSWSAGTPHPESALTFDLSSVAALNNKASIFLRLTVAPGSLAINGSPIGTGGTGRIDNVVINANPVPEPASMAALGIGLAAILRRRRTAK